MHDKLSSHMQSWWLNVNVFHMRASRITNSSHALTHQRPITSHIASKHEAIIASLVCVLMSEDVEWMNEWIDDELWSKLQQLIVLCNNFVIPYFV